MNTIDDLERFLNDLKISSSTLADTRCPETGRNALHLAAQYGHVDLFEQILIKFVNLRNTFDNSGLTPFDLLHQLISGMSFAFLHLQIFLSKNISRLFAIFSREGPIFCVLKSAFSFIFPTMYIFHALNVRYSFKSQLHFNSNRWDEYCTCAYHV